MAVPFPSAERQTPLCVMSSVHAVPDPPREEGAGPSIISQLRSLFLGILDPLHPSSLHQDIGVVSSTDPTQAPGVGTSHLERALCVPNLSRTRLPGSLPP
jgi:hypothetical protein